MPSKHRSFKDFMKSSVRNLWIKEGHLNCYLRKGVRYINDREYNSLELANISSDRPGRKDNCFIDNNVKRTGDFRIFIDLMEITAREYDYNILYIESVINEFLPDVLIRYGFSVHFIGESPCRSYYKLI